jgi:hypothetical protein
MRNLTRFSSGTSALFQDAALPMEQVSSRASSRKSWHVFPNEMRLYLGRLCYFAQCPKGKPDCRVEGCGAMPFLKQHEDFVLAATPIAD